MKCKAPDCINDSKRAGLCNAHYCRMRRYGSYDLPKTKREALVEEGKSHCPQCGTIKLIEEFKKDITTAFKISIYCKDCLKINNHERYLRKKRQHRNRNYLKDFGITVEEYDNLLTKQNQRCAICDGTNNNGKLLAVDHDHKTGKIRGLLCSRCNLTLGQMEDDIALLNKSIDYLKRSSLSNP